MGKGGNVGHGGYEAGKAGLRQEMLVPLELFPYWEYCVAMQVIAKATLREFWERHPQAKSPLSLWHAAVSKVEWNGPADVKRMFGTKVDFVADNRLIFDISGNKYRLIVHVAYEYRRVLIKFVGTHADYDRIDPERI